MIRYALSVAAIAAALASPATAFEEPCQRGIADVKEMLPAAAVGRQTQSAILWMMEEAAELCQSGQEQAAQRLNAEARMMLVSENWEHLGPADEKAEEPRAIASKYRESAAQ